MHFNFLDKEYYLDEQRWVERMTPKQGPPWRIEEVIAIQHRMKESEERILEYLRQTATPDPIDTLRKHLDEMIAKETAHEPTPS